eukprot:331977-Chlamydomonas_euryale.AAC.1
MPTTTCVKQHKAKSSTWHGAWSAHHAALTAALSPEASGTRPGHVIAPRSHLPHATLATLATPEARLSLQPRRVQSSCCGHLPLWTAPSVDRLDVNERV